MKSLVRIGLLGGAALLLLGGCERPADDGVENGAPASETGGRTTAPPPPADPLSGVFVNEKPTDARGVGEVKADVDGPEEVVVVGRIGGRVDPFVENAAVFFIADPSIKTCDELHGDGCPTPWDYCCEPKDSLMKNTATVQVVGDDGRPLKVDVKGKHGLEPKAVLTIRGEVAQRSADGALVINAKQIHVEPAAG